LAAQYWWHYYAWWAS